MQAVQLSRTHRILVGVVVTGAVVIAAIGFAGSYAAVRELAVSKGFGAFAPFFPIGIDAGIVVLLALDLLLTWIRIPFPLLRQTAWLLTAATIAFNGAAAWPDPLGVGMHAVIPVLFVVSVEAARHAIGRIADITADRHMEGVRIARWLLAFPSTFRLWRRMKLWELRSYDQVIRMEQDRLVYEARLRARFGRGWRRKAPVEALMPLRLARYGVPLAETGPAGLASAGITEPLRAAVHRPALPGAARGAQADAAGSAAPGRSAGEPGVPPATGDPATSAGVAAVAGSDGLARPGAADGAAAGTGAGVPPVSAGTAAAGVPADGRQPSAAPAGAETPAGGVGPAGLPGAPYDKSQDDGVTAAGQNAAAANGHAAPTYDSPAPAGAGVRPGAADGGYAMAHGAGSVPDGRADGNGAGPYADRPQPDSATRPAPDGYAPAGAPGDRPPTGEQAPLFGDGYQADPSTGRPNGGRPAEAPAEETPGDAHRSGVTVPVGPGRRRALGEPAEQPDDGAGDPVGIPDGVPREEVYFEAYRQFVAAEAGFPTARQLSRTLNDGFGVMRSDGSLLSETYLRRYMREFRERYNTEMGLAG